MRKFLKVIGFIIFAPFALVFGLSIGQAMNASDAAKSNTTAQVKAPTERERMESTLANTTFDFSGYKDSGLLYMDFTLKNNNKTALKDITITCKHYGPSGTFIDSNTRTIYEVVQPGKTKKWNKFSMGFVHSQAAKSSCSVTKVIS